jgi:hypothetical protein
MLQCTPPPPVSPLSGKHQVPAACSDTSVVLSMCVAAEEAGVDDAEVVGARLLEALGSLQGPFAMAWWSVR